MTTKIEKFVDIEFHEVVVSAHDKERDYILKTAVHGVYVMLKPNGAVFIGSIDERDNLGAGFHMSMAQATEFLAASLAALTEWKP